jgi:hypothetical protein
MTMLRFAILPLLLAAASIQAAPLTFGVVLDQNEAMTDPNTTKRYRACQHQQVQVRAHPQIQRDDRRLVCCRFYL